MLNKLKNLALGAAEADHKVMLALLMLSSLLSIGYLMPVVGRAFFSRPDRKPPARWPSKRRLAEGPWLCVLPPMATALGCIVLFFFAGDIYRLLQGMIGP